ncbi:MAG: YgiQ family radical SAM protein [Candidatus Dadabacteria bacterium]|nr:MAG: YgiQ family radical SAM protein [Candidatus Dadabacteria bacterium]
MSQPFRFLPEAPEGPGDVFDVVLVTGDAYVDHPAFGAALIGRYLESLGLRVGILAQPDWTRPDDFRRFGRPRLFFGVTAGNLDSAVAHYTPDRRRRKRDAYSPGGQPGRRPDRATVVYAQRCKEAYPDVPVVLGGVEASLRRFAHYDFVEDRVRRSVLADAKAEFLVYGMAERALGELARGLAAGRPPEDLRGLRGIAYRTPEPPEGEGALELPPYEEVAEDPDAFFRYFQALDRAMRQPAPPVLVQRHGPVAVVVNPPAEPLSPEELDALYHLPFTRRYPPRYDAEGGVPALEPVRWSVVTHRGCYGGCSFCALAAHQGKGIVSRPARGVVEEVRRLAQDPEFRGTLTDVGGPTANMYGTGCTKAGPGRFACDRPSCLVPEVCPHLETGGQPYLDLLRAVRRVPGVKHVFVASGLRHDLLLRPNQRRLFREIVARHVGGQMKVAPEHVANRVLRLMGKPGRRTWKEFVETFGRIRRDLDRPVYVIPYLMTGHPGCDLTDALDLAGFVSDLGRFAEQVQDFTPTPMTRSTCMYLTGRDPLTGEEVPVPKGREKRVQRALAQFQSPRNREYLIRHFEAEGRPDVLRRLYGPGYRDRARKGFDSRSKRCDTRRRSPKPHRKRSEETP